MVKSLIMQGLFVTVVTVFPHYSKRAIPQEFRFKLFKIENYSDHSIVRVWVPSLPSEGMLNRLILFSVFVFSSLIGLPYVKGGQVVWAANPNFFSMFPAVIYSIYYRVPIVRNVDDLWPEAVYDLGYFKSSIVRKLLDFVSKLTYVIPMAITPISRSYKEAIVDRYGIDEKKISVIEHGVDLSVFHPVMIEDSSYGGSFVVMYSGLLGVAYDFDVVLDAARRLSSFNDILFVIRGFGELKEEINRKIVKYSLSNVTLDTTLVDKSSLTEVLNSAHVFILPMKPLEAPERGLPTKILEYQACGKPIICCSEGESARYVSSTKSGIVVRPGDSEALANAILRLHEDERLRRELGMNGWNHISRNMNFEKIGERMVRVFSKVINHKTQQLKGRRMLNEAILV